jgi:hypothetical protein
MNRRKEHGERNVRKKEREKKTNERIKESGD